MKVTFVVTVVLAITMAMVFSSHAQVTSDLVTSLPFLNGTLWTQYSGYVVVDEAHGRALHYYFVESQNQDPDDPLVLWLNGGPGCSSLDGFLYENGPYKFTHSPTLELHDNPFAWNRVANMIYLESPAGVGFSYSNTTSDYRNASDWQTAQDNYNFLLWFFENYPEYLGRDFWIAGESYAGVYIPTLSYLIATSQSFPGNFRGLFVGNGITDQYYDGFGESLLPFVFGHGLISKVVYDATLEACFPDSNNSVCHQLERQINRLFDDIDIYNVIGDCFNQRTPSIIPCTNANKAVEYLNTAEVKQAIHVNESITWSICSDEIFQYYSSDAGSMLQYYPTLFKNDLIVTIYSGDADARVPFTGTAAWTSGLMANQSSPVIDDWVPWYYYDGSGRQTAGFKTTYAELTFITIRAAGHMVPQFQPQAAFEFFSRVISGKPI